MQGYGHGLLLGTLGPRGDHPPEQLCGLSRGSLIRNTWSDLILLCERRGEIGRPSHPSVMICKMLYLSYLVGFSGRDTQTFENGNTLHATFCIWPSMSLHLITHRPVRSDLI